MKKLAVVLSGGGSRGAIHLGVLQALDEYKISVSAVSGTSIGAIIGGLYCSGVKPYRIMEIMESKKFKDLFHFTWHIKGLLDMRKLHEILKKNIDKNSFESLNIPLHICISNIDKGEYEIFNKGELFNKIKASASIPIIFEPIKIGSSYYVDGGLFNNLPVDPFVGKYDNILGIHVNNYKNNDQHNIKAVSERVVSLLIKQNVDPNLEKCTFVINPMVDKKYNALDFKNTEKLFEIGYTTGIDFCKEFVKGSITIKG